MSAVRVREGWLRFILLAAIFSIAAPHIVAAQQPRLSGPGVASAPSVHGPLTNARGLMDEGHFKEAETALRAYIATDVGSGEARYLLAYALLRQDKPKEALQEYTRAAALETPSATQLKDVGQAYVLLDDYADAGKWMSRALQMDRSDPEIWYSMGRLRYSEQKYVEAADCFKQVLSMVPNSVKAENNLGLAYEGLNRTDEAVTAYRQAISWQEADPSAKVSEQPLLNLAIVLLHRGDVAGAEPLLTRAVVIAPANPRIREQLGQLYMQRGDFSDAVMHLREAIRLDPGKSNLHFLLGQAYKHLGRPQEAKVEFDAAARLANPPAGASSN